MNITPTLNLDEALLDRFAGIVGAPHALRADADIAPYPPEPRGRYGGTSRLVLRPGSVAEAVSYTHLDVYKRQFLDCLLIFRAGPIW